MAKVTLQEFGGLHKLVLDSTQTRLFEKELRRIKTFFPSQKGTPSLIAPDILITVQEGGKKTEYELYSRAVLRQTKTKKIWQFYFGLQLLKWLKK